MQAGGLCMVKPSLVEDANVRSFFSNLGLTEVNDFILAEQVLLPVVLWAEREFKERLDALVNFVRVFLDKLIPEQQVALKPRCLLPAWSAAKGWEMAECAGVKLHNADNDLFFRDNPEAKFVDFARLKELRNCGSGWPSKAFSQPLTARRTGAPGIRRSCRRSTANCSAHNLG